MSIIRLLDQTVLSDHVNDGISAFTQLCRSFVTAECKNQLVAEHFRFSADDFQNFDVFLAQSFCSQCPTCKYACMTRHVFR